MLSVELGGFVHQKQRGTAKHLHFNSSYVIELPCAHEFHSWAGSSGRMLKRGPAKLQLRTAAVRGLAKYTTKGKRRRMPGRNHEDYFEVKSVWGCFCPSLMPKDVLRV